MERDKEIEGAKIRVILLGQPVEIRPQGDGSALVGNTGQVRVELRGAGFDGLPLKPEVGQGTASLDASSSLE